MNKILLIYKSKYGAAKKYADILKNEIKCDCLCLKNFDKSVLNNYDSVIFAGGIYAGKINGINTFKNIYKYMKNKKSAVLCIGASPFDEKAVQKIKEHNLKGEMKNIPLFYARGIWDESIMSFKDRFLCKMLQKFVAKQNSDSVEPWMKELLSSIGKKRDWVNKDNLFPLIKFLEK